MAKSKKDAKKTKAAKAVVDPKEAKAAKAAKKAKKAKKAAKAEEKERKDAIKRAKKVADTSRAGRADLLREAVAKTDQVIGEWEHDPRLLLRVDDSFDITTFERDSTPGWPHGKKVAKQLDEVRTTMLRELQERLYAQSKGGAQDSVLLVLQGLDTAGKGGIVSHVMGLVDPYGIMLTGFKAPNEEEKRHHFLWRIKKRLPKPGYIGVFDRSHYEDLLVPTAEKMTGMADAEGNSWAVDDDVLNKRYHEIYEMEKAAVEAGMRVIKVCLLVSYEEQGVRLRERLDRPDKHWKFSPSDLATRAKWNEFNKAYEEVIKRSSTDVAPWYVIPADRKWYARLAVGQILLRTLAEIDPRWPEATYDVDEMRAELDKTMTPEALEAYRAEKTESHIRHITDDEAVGIAVGMLNASSRADAAVANAIADTASTVGEPVDGEAPAEG